MYWNILSTKHIFANINPWPNFRLIQIKENVDDHWHVAQNLKLVLGREEDIVEKGENTGNQHFPMMFSTVPGSKEFQNFYSSACHFALVLQLDKEG